MQKSVVVIAALVVAVLLVAGCGSGKSSASSSDSLPVGPYVCTDWSQVSVNQTAAKSAAVTFVGHSDASADARTSTYRAVIKFKLPGLASVGVGFIDGDGQVRASFFINPDSIADKSGYITLNMGVGVGPLKVLGLAKASNGAVTPIATVKVAEYEIGDKPATDTYRKTPSC